MFKQAALQNNINSSSYALVGEELSNTLQQATNIFETFLAERHDLRLLDECEMALRQIGGTLRLIEVRGAALIADEMRSLCQAIVSNTAALPCAATLPIPQSTSHRATGPLCSPNTSTTSPTTSYTE